jgi:L-aminoadipate-semialdehyde dehydrogenase
VIIHNGAQVHWVLEYSTLRAANVLSTVELVELCALNNPKRMVFISSTAVLDTRYYLNPANIPEGGLLESDPLAESAKGLPTGYGQTKWVSEGLLRDAGERGLRGVILRPGYVTGETQEGTTITDDFLVRILKGCIQLGAYPDLGDDNYINMMPVDGVSRLCIAAAMDSATEMPLLNTVNRTLTFNTYLSVLPQVGFSVEKVDYEVWRTKLEQYVQVSGDSKGEEHALLPLYHLAVSDLPLDSRSPVLSVANTNKLVKSASLNPGMPSVDQSILARYLAYLVAIGFVAAPANSSLPSIKLSQGRRDALAKVEGRGKI